MVTRTTLPRVYLGSKAIEARVLLVKGLPGNVLPGVDRYLGTESFKPHRIDFNIANNSLTIGGSDAAEISPIH